MGGVPPPPPEASFPSSSKALLHKSVDVVSNMGRNLYTTGARALVLVLAPLCCHAFVPANSIARGGRIRNHHVLPVMAFGGVQHAGVLVKDTKASKVSPRYNAARRCLRFWHLLMFCRSFFGSATHEFGSERLPAGSGQRARAPVVPLQNATPPEPKTHLCGLIHRISWTVGWRQFSALFRVSTVVTIQY